MPASDTPKAKQKDSAVRYAVYDVLGGPTKTAKRLAVTNQTVFKMLWAGRALSLDTARDLARATAEAGHPVTVGQLVGEEPWALSRNGGGGDGKPRRPPRRRAASTIGSSRPATLVAAPAHAELQQAVGWN
jgi:hypothetical protein